MIQDDGAPLIHSFAHGKTTYRLLWDYESAKTAISAKVGVEAFDTLMAYDRRAEYSKIETQQLVDLTAKRLPCEAVIYPRSPLCAGRPAYYDMWYTPPLYNIFLYY